MLLAAGCKDGAVRVYRITVGYVRPSSRSTLSMILTLPFVSAKVQIPSCPLSEQVQHSGSVCHIGRLSLRWQTFVMLPTVVCRVPERHWHCPCVLRTDNKVLLWKGMRLGWAGLRATTLRAINFCINFFLVVANYAGKWTALPMLSNSNDIQFWGCPARLSSTLRSLCFVFYRTPAAKCQEGRVRGRGK